MGRPAKAPSERKVKVTITPAPLVLRYVDSLIGLGKPFKDRTHAFEEAVVCLMKTRGDTPKAK